MIGDGNSILAFPYPLSTLYLPGPMKERHTRMMTASIGIIIE